MKKEINGIELEQINGGSYYIHVTKMLVCWDTIDGVYSLKCDPYAAMREMDQLNGKFGSKAEYDQACYNLLLNNGWI